MSRLRNPLQLASTILAIVAFAFSLVVPASFASAEESEKDPRWNFMGWTPSLSGSLGVLATDIEGFVIATDSSDTPIRDPAAADKSAVSGLVHFSLGLETPELPRVPGRLRFFGNVDYFLTIPPDRQAAGEGNPTGFDLRPGSPDPPEVAIEGQGSKTGVETALSAYGVTGGVSIPVEIGDFRFNIKPGVSWMRYRWDIQGVVLRAIKTGPGRDFRAIELRARGKLYLSGVGPYLAFDLEPDPWGPVLVSAFVEAGYYRTLGERRTDITAAQSISGDGLPPDTYLARWGIKLDEHFWRAGAGIRLYLAADRD